MLSSTQRDIGNPIQRGLRVVLSVVYKLTLGRVSGATAQPTHASTNIVISPTAANLDHTGAAAGPMAFVVGWATGLGRPVTPSSPSRSLEALVHPSHSLSFQRMGCPSGAWAVRGLLAARVFRPWCVNRCSGLAVRTCVPCRKPIDLRRLDRPFPAPRPRPDRSVPCPAGRTPGVHGWGGAIRRP